MLPEASQRLDLICARGEISQEGYRLGALYNILLRGGLVWAENILVVYCLACSLCASWVPCVFPHFHPQHELFPLLGMPFLIS